MRRRFRILAVALAFAPAVSACAAQSTSGKVSIRVMSYNVGGGAHIPSGSEQIEQIADQIVDEAADIVGITEIDVGTGLHDGRDMASELGVALADRGYAMHHYYEPAFQHSGGWAVHAIFSRWVIRESGYKAVKGGKTNTARWVMGHAGVDVAPGTRVHFFMTHFWPWTDDCEPEVRELFSYLAEFQGPKVAMGDFNAAMGSPTMKIVEEAGLTSSSMAVHGRKDPTVGSGAGVAGPMSLQEQIDYIVGNKDVDFTDSYVPYVSMSDHWPIVAVAQVARGNGVSEWAGDEQPKWRNFRLQGDRLSRDRAMELYRQKRYGDAAPAMWKLEENAQESDLKSFYAFTGATMQLLDGDKPGALKSYRRLFSAYQPGKWTTWGHQRAAFALAEMGEFAEAEQQLVEYIREYMTVLHPTLTTEAMARTVEQLAAWRRARGLECSTEDVLRDLAERDRGIVGRAAHYRLGLIDCRAGNMVAAAKHHEQAQLTDDRVEDGYLTCIAKGWLELGKSSKAEGYIEEYLAQLSLTTARFKRAEWEAFAHPEKSELEVLPASVSDNGAIEWSKAVSIGLAGERHVYRTSERSLGDLSAELRLAWTPSHLHVRLDVRDEQHCCPYPPQRLWQGDSVQMTIDPGANGGWTYDSRDVEIGVALGDSGVMKHVFAGRIESFDTSVARADEITTYEIAIPWTGIGLEGTEGTRLGFNILANDCDGLERLAWVDLTPGIGEVKSPILYRKLILAK